MPLPKRPYSKRGDKEKHTSHPLYRTWHNMLKRCYVEEASGYISYGGRGIDVCERWWHFENFLSDMGNKPSRYHSLERIDNDKGYFKENCKWATRSEQCFNRRKFKNNTSGEVGIAKHNFGYSARFQYEKVEYKIGRYMTEAEAVEARRVFVDLFFKDKKKAIESLPKETLWNTSTTKERGVTTHPDGGFIVRTTIKGVRYYLGYFKDLNSAIQAKREFNSLCELNMDEALKKYKK